MSTYNAYATAIVGIVAFIGAALAVVCFMGSRRLGDRRLAFVAAGFGMLMVKSLFSIYTIQNNVLHHEVTEMIGAVFDAAMVAGFAAPFVLREP